MCSYEPQVKSSCFVIIYVSYFFILYINVMQLLTLKLTQRATASETFSPKGVAQLY